MLPAWVRISVNEMKIITPAENPSEKARNEVLVRLAKKAINPPIPVARPAKRVMPKAKRNRELSIRLRYLDSV